MEEEPWVLARSLYLYTHKLSDKTYLTYRVIYPTTTMYLFADFNEKMAGRGFDADAFTVVLELGAAHFCKLVGATNLGFKKGDGTRKAYVRMDLQPNEGGFDRLEIHYQADDKMRMDFYMYQPMPGGLPAIKGKVSSVKDVEMEYMFDIFRRVTGFELEGDEPEMV